MASQEVFCNTYTTSKFCDVSPPQRKILYEPLHRVIILKALSSPTTDRSSWSSHKPMHIGYVKTCSLIITAFISLSLEKKLHKYHNILMVRMTIHVSVLGQRYQLHSSSHSLHSTSMDHVRRHKKVDTSTLDDSIHSWILPNHSTSVWTGMKHLSSITITTFWWKSIEGLLRLNT